MAKYPIKMLKDEEGTPFVPLVSTEALRTPEGETIEEKLEKKLEPSNLIAGTDITLSVDGNNITINNASKGVLIDNLTTEQSGVGSLDAHQGKILKDMIPDVVNNLTTTSTDKALSAYQGYLLNHKVVPTGGTTGQVLKKSSNDDHALEWGDAADPNAIIGDGSIKKIIELTYEEYQALETIDPDTEYHIYNVEDGTYTYISEGQIQNMIDNSIRTDEEINTLIKNNVNNTLTSNSSTMALSAAQGALLENKRMAHFTEIRSAGVKTARTINNGYNNANYMSHTLIGAYGNGNSMTEFYGGIHIPQIEKYYMFIVELNCGGHTTGSSSQFSGGVVLFQGVQGTVDSQYDDGWGNFVLAPKTDNYWKDIITKVMYVGNRTGEYVIGSVWNTYSGSDFEWNAGFGEGGSYLRVVGFLR